MHTADISLDEALDNFNAFPSNKRAAILLAVARRYWLDDMLGDESFDAILVTIQSFLAAD